MVMTIWNRIFGVSGLAVVLICALAVPLLAHGDKVIPQVANGTGGDGTVFRTKLDITNLGPEPSTRITKVKVLFFQQNGSPWTVGTNQGTTSEITLDLGAFQTIRIETTGTGSLTAGYAIVQNLETGFSTFAEDYEVAVTAYYEILKGTSVIDTVSVPVGQPTLAFVFPAETELSRDLVTGFAIVNLADSSNSVTLNLWRSTTPSSSNASGAGSQTITLTANEQRARFLNDSSLFPNVSSFRGMVLGTSERPVAILALLQTPTPTGVQYATLAPAYADALRRNSAMYLRQGMPLDADIPLSDYFGNKDDTAPWDILYETVSTSSRRLAPRSGAAFAVIGQRTDTQFDEEVTIASLKAMNYTSSTIDLSDSSSNLQSGFAFAVKTALGRYVKIRIFEVITRGTEKDLALEIYVYK